MSEALIPLTNQSSDDVIGWMFWCPGCRTCHHYITAEGAHPRGACWAFNGNTASPTFTPSLLTRHLDRQQKEKARCHLFLTDGQIEYCGDCSHDLAGKRIRLQPMPEDA